MIHTALGLVALAALAAGGLDPDDPVFPEGLTCEGAWRAETSQGAKANYEGPFNPMRGLTTVRHYRGISASVAYVCNGGFVSWRLIFLKFDTKQEAKRELERHIRLLTEQLGATCWNPAQLTAEQKGYLPDGVPSENLLSQFAIWNVRPGIMSYIRAAPLGGDPQRWHVIIKTGQAGDVRFASEDDPVKRAWDLSTCEKTGQH